VQHGTAALIHACTGRVPQARAAFVLCGPGRSVFPCSRLPTPPRPRPVCACVCVRVLTHAQRLLVHSRCSRS
jgi:hypothetical protein